MKTALSFAMDFGSYAIKGGSKYYAWLLFLAFFILVGSYTAYRQLTEGLILTGATDQITLEMFFANFVFTAHVAAAAVLVVAPGYLYHRKDMKELAVIGEIVAMVFTDCFESRIGYSSVTRVENVDPKYDYPNVKCSQITDAVLWYGDPLSGTIPMGEMPEISDDTHGDFDNAVVKPREPQLMYFNMGSNGCKTCHDGKIVPVPKGNKPRLIGMHQNIVENSLKLMHGHGALWCLNCHSATNRNKLVDRQGNEISFNQPQKLCGGCHGENYIDWRKGVHGKRIGSWVTGGKKRWWVCTECHNPHTVQVARFNRLKPEPPPALPRGMKNADYERVGNGEH